MPLREYKCNICGFVIMLFDYEPIDDCPQCRGKLQRRFSTFGIAGFNDENKERDKSEKIQMANNERDEKVYAESCQNIKERDDHWQKEFSHITNTRTPERQNHLDRRVIEGTKDHQIFKEKVETGG